MSGEVVVAYRGAVVARRALPVATRPDLAVVDALARLQLAAQRLGCIVQLRGPCPALVELLDFVGLRIEVIRQPEEREEGRVEEVVVPDDPVA